MVRPRQKTDAGRGFFGRAVPAAGPGDSARRNTAFAMAGQAATAAMTAGLTIYLVRALGPGGYGTYALAIAVGSMLLLFSDLGVSQATARFAAERRADLADLFAVIRAGLRIKVAIAVAISAILAALAGPIADAYGVPGLEAPLRLMAIALFGQSVFLFAHTAFIALRRISISFRLIASESSLELVASLALVASIGGASAAVGGRAVGYVFGALLGIGLLARYLGRTAPDGTGGSGARVSSRKMLRYAGALALVDGAYALLNQIDVLLIGAILGPAAVGLFSAPLRLLVPLGYVGLAVAQGVAPRMARTAEQEPDRELFVRAFKRLVAAQAVIAVGVFFAAEPFASIVLGDQFEASAGLTRALVPMIFLAGLAPLVSLALNYLGRARARVPIAIAALLVNAAIDLLLLSSMGIYAAALGSAVALAIYVGAHLRICLSELGLSWTDVQPRPRTPSIPKRRPTLSP